MKKIVTYLSIIVCILLVIISQMKLIKQYEINRIFEYFSIQKNKIIVKSNEMIENDEIQILFINQPDYVRENKDTVLIFSKNQVIQNIPDLYGENMFIVKYKNYIYEPFGFYKLKSWYKYNYIFELNIIHNFLILKCEISNKYEKNIKIDTISISKLGLYDKK